MVGTRDKTFLAYLVTNLVNGKKYVGVTTLALAKRWKRHCSDGQRGLGMAIKKYGKCSFTCEEIARATYLADLLELERILIKQERSLSPVGYNLCSKSHRDKIAEALRGRITPSETRAKQSESIKAWWAARKANPPSQMAISL